MGKDNDTGLDKTGKAILEAVKSNAPKGSTLDVGSPDETGKRTITASHFVAGKDHKDPKVEGVSVTYSSTGPVEVRRFENPHDPNTRIEDVTTFSNMATLQIGGFGAKKSEIFDNGGKTTDQQADQSSKASKSVVDAIQKNMGLKKPPPHYEGPKPKPSR